jgi:hypothetical protein
MASQFSTSPHVNKDLTKPLILFFWLSCRAFRVHIGFIGNPVTRGLSPLPVCVLNDSIIQGQRTITRP